MTTSSNKDKWVKKSKFKPYNAVIAHAHFTRDVTSKLSRLVHVAEAAGIDVVTGKLLLHLADAQPV